MRWSVKRAKPGILGSPKEDRAINHLQRPADVQGPEPNKFISAEGDRPICHFEVSAQTPWELVTNQQNPRAGQKDGRGGALLASRQDMLLGRAR